MQGVHVLIVDDDVSLARSLARGLASRGWAVDVAHSGHAAAELLGERKFEAVVVDLCMPDGDGFGLIEGMPSEQSPPFIVLSGALDVPTVVQAVRAGARDVLAKPVGIRQLDAALRRCGTEPAPATQRGAPLRASMEPPVGSTEAIQELILGETPCIREVREQIHNAARFPDLPVMIVGETGTGKELVAQAIHGASRAPGPLMSINCAAIPESLFESELFGHEAGAYTGAKGSRVGLLESAGAGTVFLDELGEMPSSLQPKLLRVLETRTFRPVGSNRDLPFKARTISATNRKLTGFDAPLRSDLYFRLSGFNIVTPPLRERTSDIDLLARRFLQSFAERYPDSPHEFSPWALEALHAYDWPGNVRELRSVIQQVAVRSKGDPVGVAAVAAVLQERRDELDDSRRSGTRMRVEPPITTLEPLSTVERRMVRDAWETSGRNASATARALGVPRSTLRDKLKRYGMR